MTQNSAKNASVPMGPATGDLDGYYPSPTVAGLQGRSVSATTPVTGYVLAWDGTEWAPTNGTAGNAVIFEATLTGNPENITSARSIHQSPTTTPSSFYGIVNLGSDTTGVTLGANGIFCTIAGGDQNETDGEYSVIGGGRANVTNSGNYGVISGGSGNTASNYYVTIGGGAANVANGDSVTIAGGFGGQAIGNYSTMGGGNQNIINAQNSTIGGGFTNYIGADYSTISGGNTNVIDFSNSNTSDHSFVGGGQANQVYPGSAFCVIGGGFQNTIFDMNGVIVGGNTNSIESGCTYGVIGGGSSNNIVNGGSTPDHGTIAGGFSNTINNTGSSTIGGGHSNTISTGANAVIAGGYNNTSSEDNTTISGGTGNVISSFYGTIVGGINNTAGNHGVAGGSNCTAQNFSTSFGENCLADGSWSIAVGFQNTANGGGSVALGGYVTASRNGQFSFSSSSSFLGTSQGDSQNGNMTLALQQPTVGSPFTLTTIYGTPNEFELLNPVTGSTQYFSINVRVVMMANNANVGPVTQIWELMAYTVGGVATIAGSPNNTFSYDPNAAGWTSEVTVDGTTNLIHVTILPNADATNTINAMADIKWAEIAGFAQ